MIQRIDEIEGLPEIGREYSVLAVQLARFIWRPVLAAAHTDPKYFPRIPEHFHNDIRFMTDREILAFFDDVQPANAETMALTFGTAARAVSAGPEYRPFVCHRQMPTFPSHLPYTNLQAIEDDYEHIRPEHNCRRCPHQGTPLNGMPETDGLVVCPAHGLQIDRRRGCVVRRTPPKREPLLVGIGGGL